MVEKKERHWIKLWRKSDRDPLYFKQPFDKWHAWQDLLILVDEKGKLKTSMKWLKTRWNWKSEKQVRAYLGKLKGEQKIDIKGEPSGTVITVVKWALYQSDFSQKGKPKIDKKGKQKGKQDDIYIRSSGEPSQGSAPTSDIDDDFDITKVDFDD